MRMISPDVNHTKNVLRVRQGGKILVSDGTGRGYLCQAGKIAEQEVIMRIFKIEEEGRRLPSRVQPFQGLPRSDKIELIIQKAVELGAATIVSVSVRGMVVKLELKKEEAKYRRWQAVTESAAKQFKRSLVPQVCGVMTLREAFDYVKSRGLSARLIPYEHEDGVAGTKTELNALGPRWDITVSIGPEGGFDEREIDLTLSEGVRPISLRHRVLRTGAVDPAMLSILVVRLEEAL